MPRFSPPTAIGLPRKRASVACSTDAKNASASRWMMVRAILLSFTSSRCLHRLSIQPDKDALDHQFFTWNQIGVTRVFGFEVRFALAHEKAFQRTFAVDECRHNGSVARFAAMIDNGPISVEDA